MARGGAGCGASFAINIWAIVELGFLRGTIGGNQYGGDPLRIWLSVDSSAPST